MATLPAIRKTVEHHVSAILGKLGVSTRKDAIRVSADPELGEPPAS